MIENTERKEKKDENRSTGLMEKLIKVSLEQSITSLNRTFKSLVQIESSLSP